MGRVAAVLRADPDGDREQDRAGDEGRGWPQRVKRPVIMSQATPNVSDRKKIHAKQTTWNVTRRRQK